jgi:hypothetical protein
VFAEKKGEQARHIEAKFSNICSKYPVLLRARWGAGV